MAEGTGTKPIVIVGGGEAGGSAAATLRENGFGGPVASGLTSDQTETLSSSVSATGRGMIRMDAKHDIRAVDHLTRGDSSMTSSTAQYIALRMGGPGLFPGTVP